MMERKLYCGDGCKRLQTESLDEASEWLMRQIEGLRTFQLRIEIHSKDWNCFRPSVPKTFPPDGEDEVGR